MNNNGTYIKNLRVGQSFTADFSRGTVYTVTRVGTPERGLMILEMMIPATEDRKAIHMRAHYPALTVAYVIED